MQWGRHSQHSYLHEDELQSHAIISEYPLHCISFLPFTFLPKRAFPKFGALILGRGERQCRLNRKGADIVRLFKCCIPSVTSDRMMYDFGSQEGKLFADKRRQYGRLVAFLKYIGVKFHTAFDCSNPEQYASSGVRRSSAVWGHLAF